MGKSNFNYLTLTNMSEHAEQIKSKLRFSANVQLLIKKHNKQKYLKTKIEDKLVSELWIPLFLLEENIFLKIKNQLELDFSVKNF